MGVVARLNCISIEHNAFAKIVRLQPVVGTQDPHDEEIKAFFAATPSGSVSYSVPADAVLMGVKPGDQFYLNLSAASEPAEPDSSIVRVIGLQLNGWATHVTLSARNQSGPVWEPWRIELTIRNEVAAEQLQPGAYFCVSLEKIPAN